MSKPRQFLIDMLMGLEAAIPPPAGCHHAITYAQYGSEDAGWDRLALQVNHGSEFHLFYLDDSDFDSSPAEVIEQIVAIMSEAK